MITITDNKDEIRKSHLFVDRSCEIYTFLHDVKEYDCMAIARVSSRGNVFIREFSTKVIKFK